MKMDMKTACIGTAMLVAMAWAQDAHAQRSPWWERQKAGQDAAEASDRTTPAPQAAPAYPPPPAPVAAAQPAYTYIEGGAARLDEDITGLGEDIDGGYVRGSIAVTNGLYVFGGYDRASESWSDAAGQLKVTIDQAEIGLGSSIPVSERADFIGEVSALRLGGRLAFSDRDRPQDDFDLRDHLYGNKLVFGIRARPVPQLGLWAKAGYLWVEDSWLIRDSAVGNFGIQYRFSPAWGLVGEAEIYEDVRFYRLGLRASF